MGHATEQRGGDEDDQADPERADVTDHIPEPTAEQKQAAKGDTERVGHPGQSGRTEAQILLDAWKRHDDDHEVHREHELRCKNDP
ncbi:hypothetical protein QFZ27_005497 [Inquilinus ginsengisoli]